MAFVWRRPRSHRTTTRHCGRRPTRPAPRFGGGGSASVSAMTELSRRRKFSSWNSVHGFVWEIRKPMSARFYALARHANAAMCSRSTRPGGAYRMGSFYGSTRIALLARLQHAHARPQPASQPRVEPGALPSPRERRQCQLSVPLPSASRIERVSDTVRQDRKVVREAEHERKALTRAFARRWRKTLLESKSKSTFAWTHLVLRAKKLCVKSWRTRKHKQPQFRFSSFTSVCCHS